MPDARALRRPAGGGGGRRRHRHRHRHRRWALGVLAVVVAAIASRPAVARVEPVPPPAERGTGRLLQSLVDDAARLLAGLPVDGVSPLRPLSTTPSLRQHARAVDAVWGRVTAPRVAAQRAFSAAELADVQDGAVFYPFGGPDILNAVALVPDASTYTLLGLEPVGPLPSPSLVSDGPTLAAVQRALTYALRHNIFITDAMETQVQGKVGVAALLSFFLVRSGYTIVAARPITLGVDGAIIDDVADLGSVDGAAGVATGEGSRLARVHGIELVVRREGGARLQRVRYFSGNINDDFFATGRGLTAHLLSLGTLTTLIKAASYLMYYPAFDDVRALVLARSRAIVTDTSGLPFHYLDTPGWQLSLYGTYLAPIHAFADRCQPDLKDALQRRARGPLPFSYGYSYPGHNHVVVARRAAGRAVELPAFDRSKYRGDNTLCRGDRVRVQAVTP